MTISIVASLGPFVQTAVQMAPDRLVHHATLRSAEAFLRATRWWRHTDTYAMQDGTSEFTIDTPSGTVVSEVLSVTGPSYAVAEITEDRLDADDPGWRDRTGTTPTHFFRQEDSEIALHPVPTGASLDTLTIRVSLVPYAGATSTMTDVAGAPDSLLSQSDIKDAIVCGAIADLLMMKGNGWYSPQESSVFSMKASAITDGFRRRGDTRDALKVKNRVRGHYF